MRLALALVDVVERSSRVSTGIIERALGCGVRPFIFPGCCTRFNRDMFSRQRTHGRSGHHFVNMRSERRALLFTVSLIAVPVLVWSMAGATNLEAYSCPALTANPSQAAVEKALSSCVAGDTLQGAAGLTNVNSTISLPCGVQLVGPTTYPATMKFTTSHPALFLFEQTGTCASSATSGLSYLQLDGGLALQVDGNNHSNIAFTHNQVTNITAVLGASQNGAIDFQQGNGNTINGVQIEYNEIGDSNSCTQVDNDTSSAGQDGCGIEVFTESTAASHMINFLLQHNIFSHVNEALHFYGSHYPGQVPNVPANTCDNCDIESNYFKQNHRITIEFQAQTINHPLVISNNVFTDPLNGYFNSYIVSTPCCQFGATFGSPTISPAYLFENNLAYSNTGQFEWANEFWGNGSLGENNLIQGNICTGFVPGHSSNMSISNNTIQGSIMAGGSCSNYPGSGAYISGPEDSSNAVQTIAGNVTGPTPMAITSVAPTISPASGAYSGPQTVTLSDPGYTSGPQPLGNTSIWYTTDGSTPVPGSGTAQLYTTAFSVTPPVLVKAAGMWGTPPLPTSYPAAYGFVPSAVISGDYTLTKNPAVTLSSVTVLASGHSIGQGSALQMIAGCTYSDGTTYACNTADGHGDYVSSWSSNNSAVSINASGLATGVSLGSANITATISGMVAAPWNLTVATPSGALTLTSIYLTALGNAAAISTGGTVQFTAHAIYSDGSQRVLPDSLGNKITLWNTSNHSIAKVSTLGHMTAINPGSVTVTAFANSVMASPVPITVVTPTAKAPTTGPANSLAEGDLRLNAQTSARSGSYSESQSASPVPRGPGVPLSDSFAGPLWKLEAPAGGSASISDGHLFLGVPGGGNHDAWSGRNDAVRVVQPINDENFDVSIKIDSLLFAADAGTSQGLTILGDKQNYVTYALETDGASVSLDLRTVSDGVAATVLRINSLAQYHNPMYLRLTRKRNMYVAMYSADARDWLQAASFEFAFKPSAVGPFAANYNVVPANAMPVVMSVASFEER